MPKAWAHLTYCNKCQKWTIAVEIETETDIFYFCRYCSLCLIHWHKKKLISLDKKFVEL